MKYGIWFIATELIFFSFIYLMFGEEVAKRAFLSLHSVAIGLIGIGYLTGFWDALGVWRHRRAAKRTSDFHDTQPPSP